MNNARSLKKPLSFRKDDPVPLIPLDNVSSSLKNSTFAPERSPQNFEPMEVDEIAQLQRAAIESRKLPKISKATDSLIQTLKGKNQLKNRAPRKVDLDLKYK